MTTGALAAVMPESSAHVLGSLTFGIGFVFLTVGRAELFTENFLIPVAAVFCGRAALRDAALGDHPRGELRRNHAPCPSHRRPRPTFPTACAIGARPVPVTLDHALGVASLPALHREPFDRLLVAQALKLDATLVTADAVLTGYPAETLLV